MSQPSFDLEYADERDAEMGVVTYSVGELADALNGALRRGFGEGVWVRGEIRGWGEKNGHAYFDLVEQGDSGRAVLRVSFFANSRMRLRPLLTKHRLRLADGLKVRIFGHLDYYAPSGTLGLKMSGFDPRFTLGELALHRDDVVRRLVASGLYDTNRGRPFAEVPLRIGVVTSAASAAWADFRHELERSGVGFHLRLVDVRVQGDAAVEMVSAAIRSLGNAAGLDAIVVIRGGGSKTELATFDHLSIATAIGRCPVPVLTGLGHEVDRSVADEVAHTPLKTPTACAVALVERVHAFRARREAAWRGVLTMARRHLDRSAGTVGDLAASIHRHTDNAVGRSGERLTARSQRLQAGVELAAHRAQAKLDVATAALRRVPARIDAASRSLDAIQTHVRLVDPVHTMARGWSITRTVDGRTVRDAAQLAPGDELITTFAAGSARSRVEEIPE